MTLLNQVSNNNHHSVMISHYIGDASQIIHWRDDTDSDSDDMYTDSDDDTKKYGIIHVLSKQLLC